MFSKYFKELKSSVKPYYALGGHGTPRLHPTIYTHTHIYIFQGQHPRISKQILTQTMGRCLAALKQYPNQCWPITAVHDSLCVVGPWERSWERFQHERSGSFSVLSVWNFHLQITVTSPESQWKEETVSSTKSPLLNPIDFISHT